MYKFYKQFIYIDLLFTFTSVTNYTLTDSIKTNNS